MTPKRTPTTTEIVTIRRKTASPGVILLKLPRPTPNAIAVRKAASKPTFQPAKMADVIDTQSFGRGIFCEP
jgi:hypothetical protein